MLAVCLTVQERSWISSSKQTCQDTHIILYRESRDFRSQVSGKAILWQFLFAEILTKSPLLQPDYVFPFSYMGLFVVKGPYKPSNLRINTT
jgi:hypothetical protein